MISLINYDSRVRENSEVVMKFTQILWIKMIETTNQYSIL